ncbi:MAG: T9SS type A sorting domain-containing protein [Bacteroidales bacterium]|nr:T9SS type A sorting domain-containing protein [Bacteroidales bacterium]
MLVNFLKSLIISEILYPSLAPTVTTESVVNITVNSATFNGAVIQNTEEIEARGFEYKKTTEAWEDAINISASGINNITATPTTLEQGIDYNVRAYARTLSGKTYGTVLNFGTLGLNGVNEQDISIMMYPNPATSQTKLVVSGVNGETKIVLSDVQGRVLNTINAKPTSGTLEQTIDLNNLAKGIYYIRIQNSDINRTQKLIVK